MTELWVMIYYIPLLVLFVYSLALRDNKYIVITTVSVIAFCITRMITEFVDGERYMFDFSNDVFVCVTFLWFIRKSKVAQWLIVTYAMMGLFSYIPYAAEILTNNERAITIEIIGKIQLLIILVGLIHGTRKLSKYNTHIAGVSPPALGDSYSKNDTTGMAKREFNRPFESGTHANLAKDS